MCWMRVFGDAVLVNSAMSAQGVVGFPALVSAAGERPSKLYFRHSTGRGGIVRVGNETEWTQLLSNFLESLPRCPTTVELLQRSGATISASCGTAITTASPDARWESKPYASAAFAVKDVLVVAHDPRTHPLILRHTLPATLQALAHKWTEGTLVVSNAVELLVHLVSQQVSVEHTSTFVALTQMPDGLIME